MTTVLKQLPPRVPYLDNLYGQPILDTDPDVVQSESLEGFNLKTANLKKLKEADAAVREAFTELSRLDFRKINGHLPFCKAFQKVHLTILLRTNSDKFSLSCLDLFMAYRAKAKSWFLAKIADKETALETSSKNKEKLQEHLEVFKQAVMDFDSNSAYAQTPLIDLINSCTFETPSMPAETDAVKLIEVLFERAKNAGLLVVTEENDVSILNK